MEAAAHRVSARQKKKVYTAVYIGQPFVEKRFGGLLCDHGLDFREMRYGVNKLLRSWSGLESDAIDK